MMVGVVLVLVGDVWNGEESMVNSESRGKGKESKKFKPENGVCFILKTDWDQW